MRGRSRKLASILALIAGIALAPPAQSEGQAAKEDLAIRNIFDLRTPMRDGVELSSDVFMPAGKGPYPVILIRTAYAKSAGAFVPQAGYFAKRGYAVVVQDVRGRGESDGTFDFFFPDADDGYDSVERIAKEPWSNGRVCMIGGSYMGTVQWLAASKHPPHLTCIAPTSPAGRFMNELPADGGAFNMQWGMQWLNTTSGRGFQSAQASLADWASIFWHRPLRTMDERLGRKMRLWREFLDHDTLDDYWSRINITPEAFKGIKIPILAITGTFDPNEFGALHNWINVEAEAPNPENRYLILGGWTHGQAVWGSQGKFGELTLPQDSIIDNNALILAFFEKYLKQSTTAFDQPRVRVYFTGSNQWRNFTKFPVPEARPFDLFLASEGVANTLDGNGSLALRPGGKPTDSFVYDPKNPVRHFEDDRLGPVTTFEREYGQGEDRRRMQARKDVLVYTSPTITSQLDVVGHVEVDLHASSSALDTDFTASLTDVWPDGKAISLGPAPVGVIRARYRDSLSNPSLLTPHRPYRFKIDLGHIAHSFLPGHRIRIEISSSAFPIYNPNQNTGNRIADDMEWKIADQTIYHSKARPSMLRLHVLGDPSKAFR